MEDEDDDMQDMLDGFIAVQLDEVKSQRYHKPRGKYRKHRRGRFEEICLRGLARSRRGGSMQMNSNKSTAAAASPFMPS